MGTTYFAIHPIVLNGNSVLKSRGLENVALENKKNTVLQIKKTLWILSTFLFSISSNAIFQRQNYTAPSLL